MPRLGSNTIECKRGVVVEIHAHKTIIELVIRESYDNWSYAELDKSMLNDLITSLTDARDSL